MPRFRCDSYNAGRPFTAESFGDAASKVSACLARRRGGFCYSLSVSSRTKDGGQMSYQSTSAKQVKGDRSSIKLADEYFTINIC